MKIAVVADFPRFGGTRTNIFRLLRFYQSKSLKTHVVANQADLDDDALALLETLGCTWSAISLPSGLRGRILRRTPLWGLLERSKLQKLIAAETPDLVVVSTGTPGLWLSTVLACSQPFLYFLQTSPIRRLPRCQRHLLQERLSAGQGSAIITVSSYAAEQIRKFWCDSENLPIHVIYNTAGPAEDAENAKSGPATVLTLGHVTSYKNPLFWIDVAARATRRLDPPPSFIWAGDGDLLESCRDEVQRRRLTNVQFVGFTSDVAPLYEESTVYFQPSLVESHGIAVLDAMRRGIPCVVSNRGGLPESIEHADSGICIDPSRPEEAAEALIELLRSPSKCRELGQRARERYQALFSESEWEKNIGEAHFAAGRPGYAK